MELKRKIGLTTAILIIIADVIGTGIFVTTGNVLGMTHDAFVVFVLWAVGGVVAITGSLCYAELATMWPMDGGEYVFLKKIYGFMPSFLTGWVSMVIGFTVSAAISSILVIVYFNKFFQSEFLSNLWVQKILASAVVIIFGIVHIIGVRRGSFIQNALTVLKILIVFSLIIFGFYMADWSLSERLTMNYDYVGKKSVFQYGSALLIIMYAYSGWNGTSYIAGEVENPEKTLPKAMFFGALSIVFIYLLLNAVYLISTPGMELMGKDPVGAIAAMNLFGKKFSSFFTLGIALILLSSVSVQMMIGPRVYFAMARDRMIFHSLERVNSRFNTPDLAILIQILITVIYILLGMDNIVSLLIYFGFALGIFPLLSVIGVIVSRYRFPDTPRPFKVPFYPVIPVVYILITLFMMVTSFVTSTKATLTAVSVLVLGIIIFFIWQRYLSSIENN